MTGGVRRDVPPWPGWMAAAALAGTWLAAWAAGAVVAVSAGERVGAGVMLLLVVLTAAGGTAVVLRLAAHVAPPAAAAFGLRRVPLRVGAAGVGLGMVAVGLAALAAHALGGAFGALTVPVELSVQSDFARMAGDPDPTVVEPGAAAACSVLARALIGPLFGEFLLRGFVLPILARRLGSGPAVALLAPLTGLMLAGFGGSAWLLLPGVVLGAALCLLYLDTGSILPGCALSVAWAAFLLGLAFRWDAAAAALLAVSCAALVAAPSATRLHLMVNWRSPSRSSAT